MNIYLQAFTTFFKIGAFTLGGGYAMIPIIEAEVVQKRKWIDEKLFTDLIAVAQTCPGVSAANISIFIGYKLALGHVCRRSLLFCSLQCSSISSWTSHG